MFRLVSLGVLLTLIVVLGVTFFHVLAPFLLPLFLAGVFALLCQPLLRYFIERTRGRIRLAAGLTTGCVLATITIPLIVGTILTALQFFVVASRLTDRNWTKTFREQTAPLVERLTEIVNRQLPPDQRQTPEGLRAVIDAKIRESLLDLGGRSLGVAGKTIGGTVNLLTASLLTIVTAGIGFVVFLIALYYFLADGTILLVEAEKLIPVHVPYQRELTRQFATVVRSVVMATFLAALSQGFATMAALWVFRFDHLLVLLVLAILSALIPMLGTWLVWGPCAVWLWWNGQWWQAILLAVYGVAVVGMLDNVVRTYVLNSNTKLHPLLAFISVLGGLQAMGLWGVFIGPTVASCLHALVKIFNHELGALSRERFSLGGPGGEPDTKEDRRPTGPAAPGAASLPAPPLTAAAPPRPDGSAVPEGDGALRTPSAAAESSPG